MQVAFSSLQWGLLGLRTVAALGSLIPLWAWLLLRSYVEDGRSLWLNLRQVRWWAILSLVVAGLCYTYWFIPTSTTSRDVAQQRYGAFYYIENFIAFAGLVVVYVKAVFLSRASSGRTRMELQVVLLGVSVTCVSVVALSVLRGLLGVPWLVRYQPIVIGSFYALTVLAMTSHCIFDARELSLLVVKMVGLWLSTAAVTYACSQLTGGWLPEQFALPLVTLTSIGYFVLMRSYLMRVLRISPDIAEFQRDAMMVSQRSTSTNELLDGFHRVVRDWSGCERVVILQGTQTLEAGGISLPTPSAAAVALREMSWVTPDRLARRGASSERLALGQFLKANDLALAVMSNDGTVLVGLGLPLSLRPHTYPKAEQLMLLCAIMASAFERSRFLAQAGRAAQMAAVGRLGAGLAHEIRNPLASLDALAGMIPTHCSDTMFLEKVSRLARSEVARIGDLAGQMLELASPRVRMATALDLHATLKSSLDLIAPGLAPAGVALHTDFQAAQPMVMGDVSVICQTLMNLCRNATDAMSAGTGARWIRVSTRNVAAGTEVSIEDSGPGIPVEFRARLFGSFQSTKATGMGLGLAVCRSLLAELGATITVDDWAEGRGALFRMTFLPTPTDTSPASA